MNEPHDGQNTERPKRKKRAAVQPFSPLRAVPIVSVGGIIALLPASVTPGRVGWKAYGLSCLPPEWTPPFFVIDNATTSLPDETLRAYVSECLSGLGSEHHDVIVRSSGAAETIDQRGRLSSKVCARTQIVATIRDLSKKLSEQDASGVHWIVQTYIGPLRKGHLSNERRLAREPRDFVAEFEPQGGSPGFLSSVAVRHWRDGDTPDFDLTCPSEAGVTVKLKNIAIWATALPCRILFEWVWSGTKVWMVQADRAMASRGVDPNKLRPLSIPPIHAEHLQLFRTALPEDFARYRKLKNAKMYSEMGYEMPRFYIIDDAATLKQILSGAIPTALDRDLEELTKRPLIIRTDGHELPSEKQEMLPRSDGLLTTADAKKWLLDRFRSEILRIGIDKHSLCLIAHHFIPSAAAAWARAEPEKTVVRIESLWGLPEGLYWYSHDTFEVDVTEPPPKKLKVRERRRFKGTFVAPNEEGRWINYEARHPFDWARSIARKPWLFEIARTTRAVAQRERQPVAVMWFIDNDERATDHPVIPWYHSKSDIDSPVAAPRKKFTTFSDFKIETTTDWETLKQNVAAGKRVERITLEPKDAELVRNPEFARELARFAAANHIVIELAGGILSHAYFILRREGARVECVDLFGAEEESVEYNKLVRDKVPDLIRRKGERVEVVHLSGDALLAALRQKLVEESLEVMDAKAGDELISELADVTEVIAEICRAIPVPASEIEAERIEKAKRRGGFEQGIMLTRTSTPHSLPVPNMKEQRSPSHALGGTENTIDQRDALPASRPYTRPDVRNVDQQREGLLTFETDINRLGNSEYSGVFELAIDHEEFRNFKLIVRLTRNRATIRSQLRLRLEPTQIPMKLDQLELFPEDDTEPIR